MVLDCAIVVVPAEVAEIPLQEEVLIQRQVLMKKSLTRVTLQKVLLSLKD